MSRPHHNRPCLRAACDDVYLGPGEKPIHQPGVTAAICGAKRVDQIAENVVGGERRVPEAALARVSQIVASR